MFNYLVVVLLPEVDLDDVGRLGVVINPPLARGRRPTKLILPH